ncbi:cupredoxin domain-containing protein [Candidatus Pacearchaeota archaeon]|nr:cupredoxin domain-containing protein [Candidatus Pacearchaeota archaeon]
MNKFIIALGILAIALIGIFWFNNSTGDAVKGDISNTPVKEFVIESFYDNTGIWFSLKEISVNKGDNVRIKITNIKGTHDFVIDEYGIKKMTPLNEEVIIEFTADKTGEFIYYCSIPGHRQKGQWGTLKVIG